MPSVLAALSRRAALLADGKLNEKASAASMPTALAAVSRVFAREAALKVAEEGLRLVVGAGGVSDADMSGFETSLGLPAIHRAQAGLIADMDYVADVLYGRAAKQYGAAASLKRRSARRTAVTWPDCPFTSGASSWKTLPIEPSRSWGSGAILPDAPNVAAFWENVKNGRYSISEVTPDRWDPDALLRRRPQRARQNLFQDRRLGARVHLGPDEMAPAHSAARRRRDG